MHLKILYVQMSFYLIVWLIQRITLHYSCSSNLIRESLSSNEIAQEIWRSKSRTKGCVKCHVKMIDPLTLVESCE